VKAKSVTFDRQPVIGVAKVDPVLMASRKHPELQDRFWQTGLAQYKDQASL
jgi:hypothetical protein